jgi:membrane protein
VDRDAQRLGAVLAYCTSLAIAPFLVIAIAGLAFGQEATQGEVVGQLQNLVGRDGAQIIQTMLHNAVQPTSGVIATILSVIILILSATGVFAELQNALNRIWDVKPAPSSGFLGMLRDCFLSFSMVLGTGFLLTVSLIVSAVLAALTKVFGSVVPLLDASAVVDTVLSLLFFTLLFAIIFKFLPDTSIAWRDVWLGAAITALLFVIGNFLIGFYLGQASIASAYGAAGSFVVLLVWVYYAAQIFLFGSEFTHVWAKHYGSRTEAADRPTAAGAPVRVSAQGLLSK